MPSRATVGGVASHPTRVSSSPRELAKTSVCDCPLEDLLTPLNGSQDRLTAFQCERSARGDVTSSTSGVAPHFECLRPPLNGGPGLPTETQTSGLTVRSGTVLTKPSSPIVT